MNYALFLSGGTGTRVGSERPKQYVRVNGAMMATRALLPLLSCDHIHAVYIVAQEQWRSELIQDVRTVGGDVSKIAGYAEPGNNRQLSIFNGIQEIIGALEKHMEKNEIGMEDTVLIHDAARPFLTSQLLDACYTALPGMDGVLPVLPMKDTVYQKKEENGTLELLSRETIFAGQAPELFRLNAYYQANVALLPERIYQINGATEPAILYGMKIATIPGDEANFKVTTPADLKRYQELMER